MSVDAAEIKTRVARILGDTRFRPRHRIVNLWTFVLTHEIQRGTQFICAKPGGQNYVVLGDTREVIRISKRGGDRWHAYFTMKYGLAQSEPPAIFIYQNLCAYVATQGVKSELRRFSMYDLATQTSYLSTYDGRMYKLDGSNVSVELLGEDDVFFADDDGGVPCEPEIAPHGILFDRLTDLNFAQTSIGGITPEQQRMAFTVWMFALAFPDLMPTKPLLLIEGTQGSGKTSGAMFLELALMGHKKAMQLQRNKEDDFGVTLLRRPIAIFDNVDSYIDWVPDAICAYATGTDWTRRKLFTDDESLEIKPHAFVAVASKNPASFRREDTADRCIVLRLERRATFRHFLSIEREILASRNLLFGEYLWYCNRIVAELRASAAANETESEIHRMADFAGLARMVGRVLGWTPEDVHGLMVALQSERDAFINEDDPLVTVLERWIDYKTRFGAGNRGRMISALELAHELENLAGGIGVPWKHTAKSIVQKLRSPHIERFVRVEILTVSGTKMFRMWRPTDPKINVIDGGAAPGESA